MRMKISLASHQNHHNLSSNKDNATQYQTRRNRSRAEGEPDGANKETPSEHQHQRRIFMNTNEVVFNYACECSADTTAESNNAPVIVFRPNLVDEIMRKFSSALINIGHYLRSERARLSPPEVSAVSAKLGKLLMESDSGFEKPPRGKNAERLNSAELPAPERTKPDPLRIKETEASKKRRAANALKKQRIEQKERQALRTERNSSPCLTSPLKKSTGDTQGLPDRSVRVEFRRDTQESKSLEPIKTPRELSCDSLEVPSTRVRHFKPVNTLANHHSEFRMTGSLRSHPNIRFKETVAYRKRRAQIISNMRKKEEEERKLNEILPWNSNKRSSTTPRYSEYPKTYLEYTEYPKTAPQFTEYPKIDPQFTEYPKIDPQFTEYPKIDPQFTEYPKTIPQFTEYSKTAPQCCHYSRTTRKSSDVPKSTPKYSEDLKKAPRYSDYSEFFEDTLHPPYSSNLGAAQYSDDSYSLAHHAYHAAEASMRAKLRNRRRFSKKRSSKFFPRFVLDNFNDSTESSYTSPHSGYHESPRTFTYRPTVWKNPMFDEENNQKEYVWDSLDTDTSEQGSLEENRRLEREKECIGAIKKKLSSDSLPKKLSKMSLTELPEKLFPETCRLLNDCSSTSANQKSEQDVMRENYDVQSTCLQVPQSNNDHLGSNDYRLGSNDSEKHEVYSKRLPHPWGSCNMYHQLSTDSGKDNETCEQPHDPKPPSSLYSQKDPRTDGSVYYTPGFTSDEDCWSTSSGSGYETPLDIEVVSD
ncbi:unnamed protein product [Bemisia tabaci]|uniref:Uncharacterized protein n=1 Tax=Bemisia tabaci TaxID=7038 RepID=A0A9P0AFD3_BEMTA|nr:unnamed protein product [Bemisia tabaci]